VFSALLNSIFVLSRHPNASACALAAAAAVVGASSVAGSKAERDAALVACVLVLSITCARARFVLPRVYRASSSVNFDASCVAPRAATPLTPPTQSVSLTTQLIMHLPDDVLLRLCTWLPLKDLASLAQCAHFTHTLASNPALWRVLHLPERAASIREAVRAIPRSVAGPVVISLRAGLYVEGRRSRWRQLCGLDCARGGGVAIARPLIIQKRLTDAGEGEDGEVIIESDAAEAIAFLPGSESSTLERVTVRTCSFASHAVAIYADGVRLRECSLRASGSNSCGIVLTGEGVCAQLERCDITDCGGGGVLISYGVGPVHIEECAIRRNTWSGVGAFSGSSVRIVRSDVTMNKMFAVGCARDVVVDVTEPCDFTDNELGGMHRYLSSD